jgi:hypothetical protein
VESAHTRHSSISRMPVEIMATQAIEIPKRTRRKSTSPRSVRSSNENSPEEKKCIQTAELESLRGLVTKLQSKLDNQEQEITHLKSTRPVCSVCRDSAPEVLLQKCGHVALCLSCFSQICPLEKTSSAPCPVCRARFSSATASRVYYTCDS